MNLTIIKPFINKAWTLKTWECCGLRWELIVSPQFKDRDFWEPICPICKRRRELTEILRNLRAKAIANGMKLLSEDEVLEEVKRRRAGL